MRTPILLATFGALVLAIQLGLPSAAPPSSPALQRRPPSRAVDAGPLSLPPPQVGASTPFDRPTAVTSPVAHVASWALVGIAHAGASTSLLIRDDASATHLVRPGDHIGDWRVGVPAGDQVELLRGAEHLTLSLDGPPSSNARAPT